MDILTDKQTKDYSYTSRYASFPFYYNTKDNKYIYGITSQLQDSTSYVSVDVTQETTLAYLANKYYGRPDYYWVIADFNRIQDPFIQLFGNYTKIKVPSISAIEFEE